MFSTSLNSIVLSSTNSRLFSSFCITQICMFSPLFKKAFPCDEFQTAIFVTRSAAALA